MNDNQHTVTIPMADYIELMAAKPLLPLKPVDESGEDTIAQIVKRGKEEMKKANPRLEPDRIKFYFKIEK